MTPQAPAALATARSGLRANDSDTHSVCPSLTATRLQWALMAMGAAELGLACPGSDPLDGPAAGGEDGQHERPGDADHRHTQELRIVGEEDRERRPDRQRETRALEERPVTRNTGTRSDVVLALRHGSRVAAERA